MKDMGHDLSGSMQGAGGIGGLLSATSNSTSTVFYAFDGNGNVTDLTSQNGTVVASYQYDPFGKLISATGDANILGANNYLFSTKCQDRETGLLYYGYRYLSPELGRWTSRDPLEEHGDLGLYSFCANTSVNTIDSFGLMSLQEVKDTADKLDQLSQNIKCCCDPYLDLGSVTIGTVPKVNVLSITPSSSGTGKGATVTGNASVQTEGCVYTYILYWWDCYSAQQEVPIRGNLKSWVPFSVDFHEYGYSPGKDTYSKTADPGWELGMDPLKIDMEVLVIYTYCGNDGVVHAKLKAASKGIEWKWDKNTKSWTL